MAVQLALVGRMITLFILISSGMMVAVSQQETNPPNTFGMTTDLNVVSEDSFRISSMIEQFNSDANIVASSGLFNQLWVGGSTIVVGMETMFGIFIGALTSWPIMIDIFFGFLPITVQLIAGPIKIIIFFIMTLTILDFLGGIIRSLPFFGRAA